MDTTPTEAHFSLAIKLEVQPAEAAQVCRHQENLRHVLPIPHPQRARAPI
jgi:hypothetical protein